MDPNANLKEQHELLAKRADGPLHNYDRYRLHELRTALREWIAGGGFVPDWTRYPEAADNYGTWSGQRHYRQP